MEEYRKYISALRKCAIEHENDRTFTGQIIVSDLCRDTANLLEKLEQEPTLDKIRTEIEQNAYPIVHGVNNHEKGMTLYGVLQIIDKYKAESEKT